MWGWTKGNVLTILRTKEANTWMLSYRLAERPLAARPFQAGIQALPISTKLNRLLSVGSAFLQCQADCLWGLCGTRGSDSRSFWASFSFCLACIACSEAQFNTTQPIIVRAEHSETTLDVAVEFIYDDDDDDDDDFTVCGEPGVTHKTILLGWIYIPTLRIFCATS
jgi:hypothetical protein